MKFIKIDNCYKKVCGYAHGFHDSFFHELGKILFKVEDIIRIEGSRDRINKRKLSKDNYLNSKIILKDIEDMYSTETVESLQKRLNELS